MYDDGDVGEDGGFGGGGGGCNEGGGGGGYIGGLVDKLFAFTIRSYRLTAICHTSIISRNKADTLILLF